MDRGLLLGKIVERYGTRGKFAKALRVDSSAMTHIINGDRDLRHSMILKIVELLDLTDDEVIRIFFDGPVEKTQRETA